MVCELAEDQPESEEPWPQWSWDVAIAAISIFILTQEEIVAHTGSGLTFILLLWNWVYNTNQVAGHSTVL